MLAVPADGAVRWGNEQRCAALLPAATMRGDGGGLHRRQAPQCMPSSDATGCRRPPKPPRQTHGARGAARRRGPAGTALPPQPGEARFPTEAPPRPSMAPRPIAHARAPASPGGASKAAINPAGITTAPITGTTSSSAIRPYCAERLKWEAAMGEVAVPAISDESTSIRGWPTKAGAGASWRRRRQGRGRCMRAGPTRARTVLQMNAEPAAMAIFIRPGAPRARPPPVHRVCCAPRVAVIGTRAAATIAEQPVILVINPRDQRGPRGLRRRRRARRRAVFPGKRPAWQGPTPFATRQNPRPDARIAAGGPGRRRVRADRRIEGEDARTGP